MSEIRCVYSEEPKFPATEQHVDAVRYRVGDMWVDAIGGQPSQAEIDAVVNSGGDRTDVDARKKAFDAWLLEDPARIDAQQSLIESKIDEQAMAMAKVAPG